MAMHASMQVCSLQFWVEMHDRICEHVVPLCTVVPPSAELPDAGPDETPFVEVHPASAARESEKRTEARRFVFMNDSLSGHDD